MSDIRQLLERQANWQKTQRGLSWPEKVRMAEAMRETLHHFRRMSSGERRPAEIPLPKPDGEEVKLDR